MENEAREGYRGLKDKTLAFINEYERLAGMVYTGDELSKRQEALSVRKHQLETQEFSLVVIGEMKHGKSTFLNAMLRKPVFPKDVREATAAVTFLKHNNTVREEHPDWCDKAVVEFKDRPCMVVDHLDLGKYTTCLHKGEINVAEDVKCVTIYSDSPFVNDNVTVVDTPGMNTPNAMHEQITRDQIDRSHAAVFLFKAGEAGKKSDYEFLGSTARKIDRFFFVVNRIDEIGGIGDMSNHVIEDLRQKAADDPVLGPLLAKAKFFPTSGLQALLARYPQYFPNEKFANRESWESECNPPEKRAALEKASGMGAFETSLLDFLFKGERTREFLKSHLTFIRGAIDEAGRYLDEQSDVLEKKVNLKDLEQRQKTLEVECEREKAKVESTSSELTTKLTKSMKDFIVQCDTVVATKCGEFKERVLEITDYDVMRRQWEDLIGEIDRTSMRFASQSQMDMKDTAQAVFSSIDYKVRGELNKRLGKANVFKMPELAALKLEYAVPENVAKDVEERLTKITKELEAVESQLASKETVDVALRDAEMRRVDLERERVEAMDDLRNSMQMLGTRPGVERRMVSPEHDTKEWRDGVLGLLVTPLIGKKTVHHEAEYADDDSAQRKYDADMEKLRKREDEMKAELKKRLDDARGRLSEAQRAKTERDALAKIQQNKEAKSRELQRELRESQTKAKEAALAKMQADLVRTMARQMGAVVDGLRTMSTSCAQWVTNYIGGVQGELSEAVASRKKELESLRESYSLKKKDRDEQLAKIAQARELVSTLIVDAESLTTDIEMF